MTKKEFLDGLNISLSFLSAMQREQIKAYYEKELCDISEDEDITDHVRILELPTAITDRIKNPENCPKDEEDVLEDDLIFSKPLLKEKAPEIVHSMENKEVKTLYGEKVLIENKKEPIPSIPLEPIDQANGLTNEEIEQAKAKTLEKAEKFADLTEEAEAEEIQKTQGKEPILIEEEEEPAFYPLCEKAEENKQQGLFEKFLNNMNITGGFATFLIVLFSLILAPVLLSVLSLAVGLYLFLVVAIFAISLFLILVMALFIAIGVVELIYGLLSLFQNIPVALVEIGFGTILFSLVTCFGALIYQFVFGVVPHIFKKITRFFSQSINKVRVKLYGGKA